MNDIGDQINSVVNNLADKLGIAADRLYPVLIKQAYIESITNLILMIVAIILLAIAVKVIVKNKDCWGEDVTIGTIEGSKIAAAVIVGFICLIILIAELIGMKNIIGGLFNPDWQALEMILNRLRQMQ